MDIGLQLDFMKLIYFFLVSFSFFCYTTLTTGQYERVLKYRIVSQAAAVMRVI